MKWRKQIQFANHVGGLVEGKNALYFVITGDGRTGMIALEGTADRRVAEPGRPP